MTDLSESAREIDRLKTIADNWHNRSLELKAEVEQLQTTLSLTNKDSLELADETIALRLEVEQLKADSRGLARMVIHTTKLEKLLKEKTVCAIRSYSDQLQGKEPTPYEKALAEVERLRAALDSAQDFIKWGPHSTESRAVLRVIGEAPDTKGANTPTDPSETLAPVVAELAKRMRSGKGNIAALDAKETTQ